MSFVSESELRERAHIPEMHFDTVKHLEFRAGGWIYFLNKLEHKYAFYLNFKDKKLPLLVFGQGSQLRSQVSLPRFQRLDWAGRLSYNVLIFNDPTLFYADDLTLGWCTGLIDKPVLPTHVEIVEAVRDHLEIKNKNILFYGSSAGGFTSLMMASDIDGSSAIVNNPQTNVFEFRRGGVRQLLQLCFEGKTFEQLRYLKAERFSFVDRVLNGHHVPRIYYLQNMNDRDHYEDHLLPLLRALTARAISKDEKPLGNDFILQLYSDPVSEHNPVGFSTIQSCIQQIEPWFNPDDGGKHLR